MRPGDRVVLRWTGYAGVPKELHGSTGHVVRALRTRVVVRVGERELTVRCDQIQLRVDAADVPHPAAEAARSIIDPRRRCVRCGDHLHTAHDYGEVLCWLCRRGMSR